MINHSIFGAPYFQANPRNDNMVAKTHPFLSPHVCCWMLLAFPTKSFIFERIKSCFVHVFHPDLVILVEGKHERHTTVKCPLDQLYGQSDMNQSIQSTGQETSAAVRRQVCDQPGPWYLQVSWIKQIYLYNII
jgi:hypothetical protein